MNVRVPSAPHIPRLLLVDPRLLADPFGVYGAAREESPIVRLLAPGIRPMWGLTRLADCKEMLSDRRFAVTEESEIRPDIPAAAQEHLTAFHVDGERHRRMRSLLAPAFTPGRSAAFRPRIEAIVDRLLDDVAAAGEQTTDLIASFTEPLTADVTVEFLGIPADQHARWREHARAISSGVADDYARSFDAVLQDTRDAIAYRRAHPGDDAISLLIADQTADPAQLSDLEMEAQIWITVAASSPVKHFLANAIETLLAHPDQLSLLLADETPHPGAVEELIRWSGLNLMGNPRHAVEDVPMHGVLIQAGEPVVAIHASANRDPRAFDGSDRLDVTRRLKTLEHLGFGYGPHICTGNWLARVLTGVALARLFRRFPGLGLAVDPQHLQRVKDPGTWRLETLPVTLSDRGQSIAQTRKPTS